MSRKCGKLRGRASWDPETEKRWSGMWSVVDPPFQSRSRVRNFTVYARGRDVLFLYFSSRFASRVVHFDKYTLIPMIEYFFRCGADLRTGKDSWIFVKMTSEGSNRKIQNLSTWRVEQFDGASILTGGSLRSILPTFLVFRSFPLSLSPPTTQDGRLLTSPWQIRSLHERTFWKIELCYNNWHWGDQIDTKQQHGRRLRTMTGEWPKSMVKYYGKSNWAICSFQWIPSCRYHRWMNSSIEFLCYTWLETESRSTDANMPKHRNPYWPPNQPKPNWGLCCATTLISLNPHKIWYEQNSIVIPGTTDSTCLNQRRHPHYKN